MLSVIKTKLGKGAEMEPKCCLRKADFERFPTKNIKMLKNPSTRLLEAGTRGLLSDQAMSGVSATSWACHILDCRCRVTGQQAASTVSGTTWDLLVSS